MLAQCTYNPTENIAVRFAALAFMFYSQPVAAQVANDNTMLPTESANIGTPVPEATLVSASYEPPKPEDTDLLDDAYDFAKRSGKAIVNGVKDIKLSDNTHQATAAPTVAVQQTPAPAQMTSVAPAATPLNPDRPVQVPTKEISWETISDSTTHVYERTMHMFDNDSQ